MNPLCPSSSSTTDQYYCYCATGLSTVCVNYTRLSELELQFGWEGLCVPFWVQFDQHAHHQQNLLCNWVILWNRSLGGKWALCTGCGYYTGLCRWRSTALFNVIVRLGLSGRQPRLSWARPNWARLHPQALCTGCGHQPGLWCTYFL